MLGSNCGIIKGGKHMSKTIAILCSLVGSLLLGTSASALESFTCTFGDNGKPCHELKGKTCSNKFSPTVYATCGNIADDFICLFTAKPWSSMGDKTAALKTGTDGGSPYAAALVEPAAGKLTAAYRSYRVGCEISQTK
jgi:hypothetical protein